MTLKTPTKTLSILAVALLCAASLLPVDAGAQSTQERLEDARQRVTKVQARYERLAEEYTAAWNELSRTDSRISETEASIERAEEETFELQDQLKERIRMAYRMGGVGVFHFLLEAESLRDFSLRMITLQRQSLDDEGLLLELRRKRAELERKQRELENQKQIQARQVEALRAQARRVTISLDEARRLEQDLQGQLRREEIERLFRVRRGGSVSGITIPLDSCVVSGPRHFSNDWGAPRGGGSRRHKGNDIFAPHGAPVLAVVNGTVTRHRSGGLGGLAIYLWGEGNEYYYAHLSRFTSQPGQQVSAGQQIGANGNTGNARGGAPHVHFEIHPGGGSAINPYPSLIQVC